ncbi:MAG: hypothetical protein ACOC35_06955 [Promethearchaeia archaeon]
MSIRFKKFIRRVGKKSEFKPIKNRLLNCLTEEAECKYKNYPRLLNLMDEKYEKHRSQSRISHLLKDYHEDIFDFYLNTLFPFRKRGISYENPEAPTPVDFKLVFHYRFKEKEINALEQIKEELEIDVKTKSALKKLWIFTISSFGPMVEEIFERPFSFQFFSIEEEEHENGDFEVIAIISGREQ